MSEGFAHVRRGVSRVHSRRLVADNDMTVGAPLEDEDFVLSTTSA
jgi:hypothetical protein